MRIKETLLSIHQDVDKCWLRAVLVKEAGRVHQAQLQRLGFCIDGGIDLQNNPQESQ